MDTDMNVEKLLRAYGHAMVLQQPMLPAHLNGSIHHFDFNSDRWHASGWFFCLLDELQNAHDKTPTGAGGGFIYSRQCILDAWHEHRLFGLYMSETESIRKFCSEGDRFFMTSTIFDKAKYIFPVFCIVDQAGAPDPLTPPRDHDGHRCMECLWVGERARGVGLGQRMVAEMNCLAVNNPVARDFWHKMGYTIDPSIGGSV